MTNLSKLPSNRNFGIVFFVVFLIISFYPSIYDGDITRWSLVVSIIFLILGLINSKILTWKGKKPKKNVQSLARKKKI